MTTPVAAADRMLHDEDHLGLPSAKRARTSEQQVLIRARPEDCDHMGEVYFDRSTLQSDYFKEGLERWKPDEVFPSFQLVLPAGSVADRGLRLLKKRLEAGVHEDGAKAVEWSGTLWWKASDGDGAALLTVLYIFDHIMRPDYRKEVARTVKIFRVLCPQPYLSILQHDEPSWAEVWTPRSDAPMIRTNEQALRHLLRNAVKRRGDSILLAERAIKGFPDESLAPLLLEALEDEHQQWPGSSSSKVSDSCWLCFAIERLARGSLIAANKMFELLLSRNETRDLTWAVVSDDATISLVQGVFQQVVYGPAELLGQERSSMKVFFEQMIDRVEQIRSKLSHLGDLKIRCLKDIFEAVPPYLQLAMLEGAAAYADRNPSVTPLLVECLAGCVQIAAPTARHGLLRFASALQDDDVAFLATADFPVTSSVAI